MCYSVIVLCYSSELPLNIASGGLKTPVGILAYMIHHHKGKNLTFRIGYVRLLKIKPVLNCGRLNTVMLT